jgi:hypothetical protein
MIVVAAILLLALFVSPLLLEWCERTDRRSDLFSPLRLTCCLHLLTIVPFLFMVGFDENTFPQSVRRHLERLDLAILHYAAVQAVGFLALLTGLSSRLPCALVSRLPVVGASPRSGSLLRAGIISFLVGFAAYLIYISRIGGFVELLHTTRTRSDLAAGNGYVLIFCRLMAVGVMIVICSIRYRRSVIRVVLASLTIFIAVASLSSLGGRWGTIMLIVLSLFTWHYTVRPLRSIPRQVYLVGLLLVPYFIAMPLLRVPGGLLRYSHQPDQLWIAIRTNLYTVVTDLSYVDTYTFIVNHFDTTNLWLGRSYLDLAVAPIPSTIYLDKPPIDDGVYIRSLEEGIAVVPGMPYHDLYHSSTPPETLGLCYLNFWWPGMIFGMYLLGSVYKAAYFYMAHSSYSLHSVYLYATIMFGFQLTNFQIVALAVNIAVSTLTLGLLLGFRRMARREVFPLVRVPKNRSRFAHGQRTGAAC